MRARKVFGIRRIEKHIANNDLDNVRYGENPQQAVIVKVSFYCIEKRDIDRFEEVSVLSILLALCQKKSISVLLILPYSSSLVVEIFKALVLVALQLLVV